MAWQFEYTKYSYVRPFALLALIPIPLFLLITGACKSYIDLTRKRGYCQDPIEVLNFPNWSDPNGYSEMYIHYVVLVCVAICIPISIYLILKSVKIRQPGSEAEAIRQGGETRNFYPARVTPPQLLRDKIMLIVGAILMCACGGLELWLQTGFGKVTGDFRYWMMTGVNCLIVALFYIIDFGLGIYVEKTEQPDNRYQVAGQQGDFMLPETRYDK